MKFTNNVINACLDIFKSYPISSRDNKNNDYTDKNKVNNKETIKNGFYIHPDVLRFSDDFSENKEEKLELITDKVGFDIFKLNNGSLHKSFATVRDASDEELIIDQLAHYLTTYGFKSVGIFDESLIYIPNEVLNIDEKENPVFINIVNAITISEIKEKIIELLLSGVALAPKTIVHIENIISDLKFKDSDFGSFIDNIKDIKNKEIRSFLYDYFDIVPENPTEFLRFIIFKVTGKTVIIKDKVLFNMIKSSGREEDIYHYLNKYNCLYDIKKLATIFYRYKMLWLAMKNSRTSSFINNMRRLAVKYHKPAKIKILDTITNPSFIVDENVISEVKKELKNVTIYKKISILNAISYRLAKPDSIAYVIRNGSIYYKEIDNKESSDTVPSLRIFNIIKKDVIDSLAKNVKNKKFYIPSNINYAMPTSEKLFIGSIPYNTTITLGKSAIVGVAWNNIKGESTDLDIHCHNTSNEDFGWDSYYRGGDVYFSGDMTDATNGATEAFYIGKDAKKSESYLFDFNFFNIDDFSDMNINSNGFDYKLIIDTAKDGIDKDNILNASSIACHVNCKSYKANNSIGLLDNDSDGNKSFIFMNYATGDEISSTNKDKNHLLNYLKTSAKTRMSFNSLIAEAGGKIYFDKDLFNSLLIKEKEEEINKTLKDNPDMTEGEKEEIALTVSKNFIDLSLSSLQTDTLLNFVK